ncbi:MAG: hypothetical protein ACOX6T_21860 [Myxococcales bacterium]|jgi:hypothetical protein
MHRPPAIVTFLGMRTSLSKLVWPVLAGLLAASSPSVGSAAAAEPKRSAVAESSGRVRAKREGERREGADEPKLGRGVRIIKPRTGLSEGEAGRAVGPEAAEERPNAAPGVGNSEASGERNARRAGEEAQYGAAAGNAAEEPPGGTKGELIYVGPPIDTADPEPEAAGGDTGAAARAGDYPAGELEAGEGEAGTGAAGDAEESEAAQDDTEQRDAYGANQGGEINQLREEIARLREQLEQQPGEGVARIQELESRLVRLEQDARLMEQARLERVAGYDDVADRLRDVRRSLADGEWQVLETVGWAEWLLRVYAEEAYRMGALAEIENIDSALKQLAEMRVALENEDLQDARINLTLSIAAIELAQRSAMAATSPVNGAVNQ